MTDGPNVWAGLVHYPVLDKGGGVITTSVTNMDVHDLGRSARTFGLRAVFMITPIDIHREMVARVVSLWHEPAYWRRTPSRRDALDLVRVAAGIGEAARVVQGEGGGEPELIATSARRREGTLSFGALRARLREDPARPRLLLFGTGWGLAPAALDACGATLEPVEGRDGWAHLSVRSAAAIILDRLLGSREY